MRDFLRGAAPQKILNLRSSKNIFSKARVLGKNVLLGDGRVKTVFETGPMAGNFWSLVPVAVAAAVLVAVLVRRGLGKGPDKKLIALGIAFAAVGFVMLFQDARVYRAVVVPYYQGAYRTVEGPVEDFAPAAAWQNPRESFTVNGVEFVIDGEAEGYFGYDRASISGGAIHENGMYVKIRYTSYDGINVILRLEVEDAGTTPAA